MGLIAMLGGSCILAIGIVGEYVGNIFEEVKRRPSYIVERCLNCSTPTSSQNAGKPAVSPPKDEQ